MKRLTLYHGKNGQVTRVDFHNNRWDRQIRVLAQLGISYKAIAQVTGYSSGKVARRMSILKNKHSISVMDYRRGESAISKQVIRSCQNMAGRKNAQLQIRQRLLTNVD